MSEHSALLRLVSVNRLFIANQREINAALMNTFLGVAIWYGEAHSRDPLSLSELAKRLDLKPSTVSRHLRYLGSGERADRPGMGLVELYAAPGDGRRKMVRLTLEGEALLARLLLIAN